MTDVKAAEELLCNLNREFDAACANKDAAALDRMLADGYIHTHSDNNHESREKYIAGTLDPSNQAVRTVTDLQAEVHDDVAVTRGNMDISYPDGRMSYLRFVRIYRLQNGEWKGISHRTFPAKDRIPA